MLKNGKYTDRRRRKNIDRIPADGAQIRLLQAQAGPFRHEIKHEISEADRFLLRGRLHAALRVDPNGVDGCYRVRSLYFDNADDKALREKIDGAPRREKFRIRFYQGDPSRLTLEKKSKIITLCAKVSEPLDPDVCRAVLAGNFDALRSGGSLCRELFCKMRTQQLRPRTVVDYSREAFLCSAGNVRITVDSDIRARLTPRGFLSPRLPELSVGRAVLEVKYDAFLPDFVRDLVQLPGRRAAAFSKYAACRQFV